ncbi:NADH-quinone oxidoreductase subunit K [Mycetocola spongiae]|uniref:NADH-quinone oxidoreductase subunit K n=1 Tax=Mycetocola spongiae TaxID=2859226 RepID=UPI001CF1936E|nr:NADH-quinone oxidoreductase subunit K [Mycetocola spongiae]UCR88721.1 NADH-quinone oxidoreductase subunit K [Mycetocola spongiae]
MSASLTLVLLMSLMYSVGIYVMLERSLTRFLIGFLLVGNATNILIFLMSGHSGNAPLVTGGPGDADMVDPLPQIMILTAIVINFGVTAFVLALIYRTWWLAQLGDEGDTLPDDHLHDTEQDSEEAFRQVDEDDEAIQRVLDASNEHSEGFSGEFATGMIPAQSEQISEDNRGEAGK